MNPPPNHPEPHPQTRRRRARPRTAPPPTIERFGHQTGPDVLLLVSKEGTRFTCILSESILRQLGHRWQTLLDTRPRRLPHRLTTLLHRSDVSKVKILNLRDDYAPVIRVVLLLATHQYAKVPRSLDFHDVVQLADVARRYEVYSLLVEHVWRWLIPYVDTLTSRGYEEWLFVAYQFRLGYEYRRLARHLAMHCGVTACGAKLLAPGRDEVLEGPLLDGLLGGWPIYLHARCTG